MTNDVCKSCGAALLWVSSSNGKPMPLDAQPAEDGNLVVDIPDDPREPFVARAMKPAERRDLNRSRFKAHFATCPQADEHRHPRGAGR